MPENFQEAADRPQDSPNTLFGDIATENQAGRSEPASEDKKSGMADISDIDQEQARSGEKLSTGDMITSSGGKLTMTMPGGDKLELDPRNGAYKIDTDRKYETELRYRDTPWETRTLIFQNGDHIVFDKENFTWIQRGNNAVAIGDTNEPPNPTFDEMQKFFQQKGRDDLSDDVDKLKTDNDKYFELRRKTNFGVPTREQVISGSDLMMGIGILDDALAKLYPEKAEQYRAAAEQHFRSAYDDLTDRFGRGTPACKRASEMLADHLRSKPGNETEVKRLEQETANAEKMQSSINVGAVRDSERYSDNHTADLILKDTRLELVTAPPEKR